MEWHLWFGFEMTFSSMLRNVILKGLKLIFRIARVGILRFYVIVVVISLYVEKALETCKAFTICVLQAVKYYLIQGPSNFIYYATPATLILIN